MSKGIVTRLCAAGGAFYVIVSMLGTSGNSHAPSLSSSRAAIGRWTAQQHTGSAHYVLGALMVVALVAVIPFAAALWRTLRDAEGEPALLSTTMLGGAFVWVALKLASATPEFALHWRSQAMSAQLASALHDMGDIAFVMAWVPQALMLGCAAAIILRTAVLPRWLGWLAAVTSVVLLASVPVSNHVPPLGVFLMLLWVLATSIVLVRRPERVARAAVAATA